MAVTDFFRFLNKFANIWRQEEDHDDTPPICPCDGSCGGSVRSVRRDQASRIVIVRSFYRAAALKSRQCSDRVSYGKIGKPGTSDNQAEAGAGR
jgi:hypothetical protein